MFSFLRLYFTGNDATLLSFFLFDYSADANCGNRDYGNNNYCWVHNFSPFI